MSRFPGTPIETSAPRSRFPGIPISDGPTVKPKAQSLDLTVAGARGQMPSTNLEQNGRPVFTSGVAENAAAGINSLIPEVIGGAVDRARNVINWGIAGANAATGKPLTENMLPDTIGGSKSIGNLYDMVGIRRPENVIAKSPVEQIARGAGGALAATVVPEMALVTAERTGMLAPKIAEVLAPFFGNGSGMIRNAAAGAAAGAGASAAEQVAPEPLKPLAATVGAIAGGGAGVLASEAPTIAKTGTRLASDWLAPLTQGGRERIAGEHLAEAATNPGTAAQALDQAGEIIPGSKPTTGQATGDLGLLSLERSVATRNPELFNQRRADQNAARLDALGGIEPGGAPEQVAQAARSYLDDIDRMTQQAVDSTTEAARNRTTALGTGQTPDVAGADLRGSYEAARNAAKTQERALWAAVDPEGTLVLPSDRIVATARQIVQETPRTAKAPGGEEAAIFAATDKLGANAPLSEVTALQSRIKTELRAERLANGESAAYRRLARLNDAVQAQLDGAIVRRVQQDRQAVAAGQMQPEDAFEAYWLRQRDKWFADRAARAAESGDTGATAFRDGGAGSVALPGVRGTAGQGGRELPGAPRDQGLPGNARGGEVPVDEAALGRLNAARAATRNRVEIFDNATLNALRRRATSSGPYDMPDGAVGQRLFFAGPKSFDAIQAYRRAVGDGPAMATLADYIVNRLRNAALRDDGTLDPRKVDAFRRTHADALRAFPKLDAALADAAHASEAIGQVLAIRKEGLDDAQLGALGKLIGVDNPNDVVRTVGSIFDRQDAAAAMTRLRTAIRGNPDGLKGLRRAVAEFIRQKFISTTEAGTSGNGTLRSNAFQTFTGRNEAALRAAGFDDTELGLMKALGTDLQQADRSLNATRIPGQSNTAQDLLAARQETPQASLLKIMAAAAAGGGSAAWLGGPWAGAAATFVTGIVGVLRQSGLAKVDDLVTEAMLNPAIARMLLARVKTPEQAQSIAGKLAARFARSIEAATASAEDQ